MTTTREVEDDVVKVRSVLDYPSSGTVTYNTALQALDRLAALALKAARDEERVEETRELLANAAAVERPEPLMLIGDWSNPKEEAIVAMAASVERFAVAAESVVAVLDRAEQRALAAAEVDAVPGPPKPIKPAEPTYG